MLQTSNNMIIKTKRFQLSKNQYIKLAFANILRQQWWVPIVLSSASIGLFVYTKSWWAITPIILLMLYLAFWWIQFYGVTKLEQNQLLFDRLTYQISAQQIIVALNPKHGMPISWKDIQYGKQGKDYFLLFLSRAQFIYLPFKIFNNPNEIQLVATLLKRKQVIK